MLVKFEAYYEIEESQEPELREFLESKMDEMCGSDDPHPEECKWGLLIASVNPDDISLQKNLECECDCCSH